MPRAFLLLHLRGIAAVALAALLAGCESRSVPSAASAARVASWSTLSSAMARVPGSAAGPHDAFVLLSGGGSPTSNNYSQYLQARAVSAAWLQGYPREAVWIFFGAGNREGEKPALADVYRQVKYDGLLLDTWLPGLLPENRAAAKSNFLRTLRREILPRVRGGGTLYLFVGDHGELVGRKETQSAITMWGMRRDTAQPRGWSAERDDTLTVSELREALRAGLGAGRVVFAMTQCHSGGFHDLGVEPNVQPPRAWFAVEPGWYTGRTGRILPAAGFTATDKASIAAGCDPNPDPETWAGYERYFPEQLLGRDLSADAPVGAGPAVSFAAAHVAATLVDETLDKPRSSSEHYLERWATLIETQLARELMVATPVRAALEAYQRGVDTGTIHATHDDVAWRETEEVHTRFLAQMSAQNPAVQPLLSTGRRAALEAAARAEHDHDAHDGDAPGEARLSRAHIQSWREHIRPAWVKAVAAGEVPELPAAAIAFEQRLQAMETRGRPQAFSDVWSDRALTELYWSSTYAVPEAFDPATAAAATRWAAQRRAVILAWAARSPNAEVRAAAQSFPAGFTRPRRAPDAEPMGLSAATAAERALFYRRVLAAWAFLIALDHQQALARVHSLRQLERTPLPAPHAR